MMQNDSFKQLHINMFQVLQLAIWFLLLLHAVLEILMLEYYYIYNAARKQF